MKEGLLELKRSSKARENSWPARFRSQRRPLRKWPLAVKLFRSQNSPLRNRHFAAKLFCSPKKPLRKHHFAVKSFCSPMPPFAKFFAAAKWLRNPQSVKTPIFAAKAPFRRVFRSCETPLWHTSAISQYTPLISQLQNGLRNGIRKWPSTTKLAFLCEN